MDTGNNGQTALIVEALQRLVLESLKHLPWREYIWQPLVALPPDM